MSSNISVTIINQLGLHVRASSKLVDCASRFVAKITIKFDKKQADAKRIIEVMSLGAGLGAQLEIVADGSDEVLALQALNELFLTGFGEI